MFQVELETMELESPFLPSKLQSTMLKKLHQGLQGGESMICRAREVVYWHGMQAAILQESAKCSLSPSYGSVSTLKGTDVVIHLTGPIQARWGLVFYYIRALQ